MDQNIHETAEFQRLMKEMKAAGEVIKRSSTPTTRLPSPGGSGRRINLSSHPMAINTFVPAPYYEHFTMGTSTYTYPTVPTTTPRNYGSAGTLYRLFRHIEIPATWDLKQDRNQALGMLFTERSLKNDAVYTNELATARKCMMEAWGIGPGIWKHWCYDGGMEVDPIFNKVMYYLAWMLEKSRLLQAHPDEVGLPLGVYELVKDIRYIEDPGFKKLSDLLAIWSGVPPESPKDELAFDPNELAQNAHRLGLTHLLPRPEQPLERPTRYPDPLLSGLSATEYLPVYGPPVPEEWMKNPFLTAPGRP